MGRIGWWGVLGLMLVPLGASGETSWEQLMGPGPTTPWTDPRGRFSLALPTGWAASALGEQVVLTRTAPHGGRWAHVTIEVRRVPPKTSVRHFERRVAAEVESTARGYEELERSERPAGRGTAIWRYFVHDEDGNAELKREVVQVVQIAGDRGFVVSLETAYGARGRVWADFQRIMTGFAPGITGSAPADPPGGRHRIRAGELVNPDAVGY